MAEINSTTRERRRGGCRCSRCMGDMVVEDKGKATEDW